MQKLFQISSSALLEIVDKDDISQKSVLKFWYSYDLQHYTTIFVFSIDSWTWFVSRKFAIKNRIEFCGTLSNTHVCLKSFPHLGYGMQVQMLNNAKFCITGSEFETLLSLMPLITLSFQFVYKYNTLKKSNDGKVMRLPVAKECDKCKHWMKPIVLFYGKMMHTDGVDGVSCQYCEDRITSICHCHRYDCKTCEPDNFCSNCQSIIVYPHSDSRVVLKKQEHNCTARVMIQ